MYLCIDIGGTKTLLAVLNKQGSIVESIKFPTPQDYDQFLQTLTESIDGLEHKNFDRVCSAAPGKISRKDSTGVVLAFSNLPWENIPLQADLELITHTPTLIENDSKLAGLSEAILLKDTYKKALYVTISTGIGSVMVVDGVIDVVLQDSEVGHMLLEHEGRFERWEKFASGKAIYNKYQMKASDIEDPRIWYVIAHNIAVGLINLIASYTPEVVIIGGGVGTHLDKFQARLEEDLKIYSSPMFSIPPIFKAQRPEEAVIYGCYEYIQQHI